MKDFIMATPQIVNSVNVHYNSDWSRIKQYEERNVLGHNESVTVYREGWNFTDRVATFAVALIFSIPLVTLFLSDVRNLWSHAFRNREVVKSPTFDDHLDMVIKRDPIRVYFEYTKNGEITFDPTRTAAPFHLYPRGVEERINARIKEGIANRSIEAINQEYTVNGSDVEFSVGEWHMALQPGGEIRCTEKETCFKAELSELNEELLRPLVINVLSKNTDLQNALGWKDLFNQWCPKDKVE